MTVWNPNLYQDQHSFVWKYGSDLLPLLNPQPGDRILDVGCGTGQLTASIAEAGAIVTGMDSSAEMVAKAAVNYPAIPFLVGDIRNWRSDQRFDAVFSNAVLHWVKDADAAAASIAAALRPGGRFVAEFGGCGNTRLLLEKGELQNPWYYPGISEYAGVLERNGLETRQAFLIDRPTRLEDPQFGLRNWMAMFGKQWKLDQPALMELEEKLRPHLFYDGHWHIDYRRIRIVAVKW